MKTRKFTAMLLTLAMAFSLLTVSAGAVMDASALILQALCRWYGIVKP